MKSNVKNEISFKVNGVFISNTCCSPIPILVIRTSFLRWSFCVQYNTASALEYVYSTVRNPR